MPSLSIIIAACIAVESGGNPLALGDHGEARGVLQIHRCVVEDVNRFAHTHYTWDDAWNVEKSEKIFSLYVGHYDTPQRLGHAATDEDMARTWNGGPNGWKKPCSIPYWKRVQQKIFR